MVYAMLQEDAQKDIVDNRIRDLEREHFQLLVSLKIAEAKMAQGLPNSEAEVIEVQMRLKVVEISLLALSDYGK